MKTSAERPIVYITGAGPGDPGLLTLKAKDVIKKSTALVYDALVSDEILNLIKVINLEIEFIYVGKKAYVDDKRMSQENIHELLLDLTKKHKAICRLKGGDPSVFGRVGEEAEFLAKNNILFEIVPGVTSVVSASAYSGIPLTHRDCTSSFTVVTAHEDPDTLHSSINWESFDAVNNTLVLLMGTKNLPKIVNKLISLGRKKETPIAIIYRGTTPEQKTWTSTLENVVNDIAEEKITHPSLIIVGQVVNYKQVIDWYEKNDLLGKRVLLTRSKEQSVSLSKSLSSKGAKPILCPIVEYKINDAEIYNKKIVNNIKSYDWLFFTSQNAVEFFFEILKMNAYDSRVLDGVKVAAVGFKTKQALEKYNILADFIPKKFSLKSLISELSEKENLQNLSILHPTQCDISHDIEMNNLCKWPIYKADFISELDDDTVSKISEGIDVITFFSSNTAKHFSEMIKSNNLEKQMENVKFAVVGSETANACKKLFGKVDIIAEPYTEDGLLSSIEKYYYDCKKVLA